MTAASLMSDAAWQERVDESSEDKDWVKKAESARELAKEAREKIKSAGAPESDVWEKLAAFRDEFAEQALLPLPPDRKVKRADNKVRNDRRSGSAEILAWRVRE